MMTVSVIIKGIEGGAGEGRKQSVARAETTKGPCMQTIDERTKGISEPKGNPVEYDGIMLAEEVQRRACDAIVYSNTPCTPDR